MKYSREEYKEFLLIRLTNSLKGEAQQILMDRSTSTEDKEIYMKLVEKMKRHIDNFEVNKEFIQNYNKQIEDDLR